jgi:hypothetical protein
MGLVVINRDYVKSQLLVNISGRKEESSMRSLNPIRFRKTEINNMASKVSWQEGYGEGSVGVF